MEEEESSNCYDFAIPTWLSRVEFDSQRWIQHVEEPVLMLHAMDDQTIPYELGKWN